MVGDDLSIFLGFLVGVLVINLERIGCCWCSGFFIDIEDVVEDWDDWVNVDQLLPHRFAQA